MQPSITEEERETEAIEFKDVEMHHKALVDRYFRGSGNIGSEYTFSNLFIWRKNYFTQLAEYRGFLLVKYHINGRDYYLMPVGSGEDSDVADAVRSIGNHSATSGSQLVIAGIGNGKVELLERCFPGQFEFRKKPDWFDYIYNASDLIELRGSKYQAKRNHINQFERKNGKDTFEELSESNIEECVDTYRKWTAEHEIGEAEAEHSSVSEALMNYRALELKGGITRVKGLVCGFSLGGEINSDTFVIHVEKGLRQCQGVYAALNRDFASRYCQDYKYINREEDLGIEGLRKAKLSYYPAFLHEKYVAELKGTL